MTTRYHVDPEPGAASRIARELVRMTAVLEERGPPRGPGQARTRRVRQPAAYSPEHYHEVHIKLDLPESEHSAIYPHLVELGDHEGFRPSRNPNERRGGRIHQFVNGRIYSGDRISADTQVQHWLTVLQRYTVHEVKRETVIFDTHADLDRWWLR